MDKFREVLSSLETSAPQRRPGMLRSSKVAPGAPPAAIATEPPGPALVATPPPEMFRELTALDDRLVEALGRGDIRIVRCAWLLAQPLEFRMLPRQQLEAVEAAGATPSPLLSPDEAVALIRRSTRSLGVLSTGWLSPGHPDPAGARVQVLRRTVAERPHIGGLFFECATLS